jgi:hypothetical protein
MNNRWFKGRKIAPLALVGAGVLLGVLMGELGRPQAAMAQPGDQIKPENILSAGAQRNQMIDKLSAIEARLGKIESKLNAPLSVKVLEMPAMKSDGK